MKRSFLLWALLSATALSFGQKGFGLDGSLGLGLNGSSEPINPVLLEGRVQWNDFFSTNLGLGLWSSSYKSVWNEEVGTNATIYKLIDNKALPSVQAGLKCQYPIVKILGREFKVFVEPKLLFLPFSTRTSSLNELYYTISYDGTNKVFTPGPSENNVKTSLETDSHARFYYAIQGGLSVNLLDHFDLSLGYGYSNMDLFKELRGRSMKGFELNNYVPASGMQLITISLQYQYNLN